MFYFNSIIELCFRIYAASSYDINLRIIIGCIDIINLGFNEMSRTLHDMS